MKPCAWMMTVALAVLAACGCIPRRVFWSPDGQRAAILADDGLRLCDAGGKLSPVVAEDVGLIAWLPDSRRFIAASGTKAKTWEQAAEALTPERREALIRLADRMREETLAYSGDWNQFKPKVAAEMSDGELTALVLYIHDHRSQGLPEKLGEKWKELENATADVQVLQLYEVSDLAATPGRVLVKVLDGAGELRVSPDGQAVACVQTITGGERPNLRLSVLPVSGGWPRTVAEPVAFYPDWSADGRSLVYATARLKPSEVSDALQLGALTQRRVRDESGALLKEFAAPEDLVGVLFWPQLKVRCLRDGRVLFAASEVTLPAISRDMPQRASLFSIDPGRRPTVARVIPRESEAILPDGLGVGNFEPSPDQTRIAVTSAEHGNVSVLTLATGDVQPVVVETDSELISVPAWRTAQELAVFVPPKSKWGSPERYELALWSSPEQAKCLSCDWPELFKERKAQPASSPASGPASAE